jgi:AcrR family transcriptional regulator
VLAAAETEFSAVGLKASIEAIARRAGVGLPTAEEPLRQSLHQAIAALVARAQETGTIRRDIGPADVAMLISGAAHAASIAGDLDPTLRECSARIILDGLRPVHPTPLPGRPLDFAQLRRLEPSRRS